MNKKIKEEIKKLIDKIGYDSEGKEWEYDSVYVTREEVTSRLLEDIEFLCKKKIK